MSEHGTGAALFGAQTIGADRLNALQTALAAVRRGGTVSVVGVYGGALDPTNLMRLFDRQMTLRMGQANVRRWADELFAPLEADQDPFGVDSLASHHLPLSQGPEAHRMFHEKRDGCVKAVLEP
ncbi:MAG: hypothetical protein QM628_17470 [Propionicimonas sp.]